MAVRRSSIVGEHDLFAEYPFLPGAERLVDDLAVSVRDLLSDPVYARARELGRARLRVAADEPTGATGVDELVRASAAERFLSFYYARLLLTAAPSPAPRRRWAVAEAKQGYGRWRAAGLPELAEVAARLERPIEPVGEGVTLALPDYLHLATPIREADFRLARQRVAAGRVTVERDRAARLLQEAVRATLAQPLELTAEVVGAIRDHEREFLDELSRRMPLPARPGPTGAGLLPERFPPCIRRMRRALQAGENLSHSGRFALAAFLHRAGADGETIVDAYRGAPDFDEAITRYQVEHITQRDGGLGYMPPECETLRSHGLCIRDGDPAAPDPADRSRDPLCYEPFLRHPLQYYRLRGGTVREDPGREEASERRGGPGARP
jgi:DNA primase large subunit